MTDSLNKVVEMQSANTTIHNISSPWLSMDPGTLLGILGVALTIIFFFIGYRQTIGAKKERAAGANKEMIDMLLRRLTLDDDFSIKSHNIEKIIMGKSLDHRVLPSDLYDEEQIESILYSRIVDSDYIGKDKRNSALSRLENCFRVEKKEEINFQLSGKNAIAAPSRAAPLSEVMLGAISAFSAVIVTTVTAALSIKNADFDSLLRYVPEVVIGFVLIFITAGALVAYAKLRDRAKSTLAEMPNVDRLRQIRSDFERVFAERMAKAKISAWPDKVVDFIVENGLERSAVELKWDVNRLPRSLLERTIATVEKAARENHCAHGIIVSGCPVSARVASLSTSTVQIIDFERFFSKFEANAVSGAS